VSPPEAAPATRDALIIAAGYGSRLASHAPCKPLAPVAGVPLIELAVRQAAAAGIGRVVVVTGHRAAELERFLAGLAARLGIAIEPARAEDWSRPNGWSVLTGARRIAGDYLLLMADHLFEASVLRGLLAVPPAGRGVTLAVDTRLDNPLVDPDDATWVRRHLDGRIAAIGKGLADADAVDCGAFLASPELAEGIAAAIAEGRPGTLSDGMQRLATAGRAWTAPVGEAWWLDVDDPRAHALAEAQAPARLAPLYAAAL
jgi:1L-myo-inositol 1-phosphate cytidylyltransferase